MVNSPPLQHWSRLPPWARRGVAVVLSLAFTEGLLRIGFLVFAHTTQPNCGLRPELLGRLIYAYSHARPSPDATDTGGVVPDAHRGYRHAPGLRDRELDGVRLSTNSLGMRGTREYARPRPPTGVRVAAVGDSFTFGEGVPDDATWPAQLERALPGAEVMNLGERAYAHDQMYFALNDVGMPLEPDAVILGFYANDLWRDELTFYCSEKPRFSPASGGWRVENVPVPTPWAAYDRDRRLPLLYAVPRVLLEALVQPTLTDRSGAERATEAIRRMRRLAEDTGARFVLVNLPDHPERPPETNNFFHDYCAQTSAECVDAWPLFRATAGTDDPEALRARYQRPHDIHYSREGYAVVAEALRRYFAEHPLARAARPPSHPSLP